MKKNNEFKKKQAAIRLKEGFPSFEEVLRHQSKLMIDLANNLVEGGRPLEDRDKDLIRQAYVPVVKDELRAIKGAFLCEDSEYVAACLESLKRLNTILADL